MFSEKVLTGSMKKCLIYAKYSNILRRFANQLSGKFVLRLILFLLDCLKLRNLNVPETDRVTLLPVCYEN